MSATPAERARSFGALAELYDRVRPGYPDGAVDVAVPPGAATVVDVGAGTGKLTASLVARGLRVIAVEPDDNMRAVLSERVPGADVRGGTAEELPVGDGEADAVVFAQSWHWTDPSKAPAEVARVLRPGGTLSLVWNANDDRIPWAKELLRITRSKATFSDFGGPETIPGFEAGKRTDVAWEHSLSHTELVDLVLTWSSVSTLPEAERDEVRAEVGQLLAPMDEPIVLQNVCVVLSYRRSG